MHRPQSRFRYASYFSSAPIATTPLTRKDFYRIAQECNEAATELARYDQHRVRLKQCHSFNEWLQTLKAYTLLGPQIANMTPARPVTRWQLLVVGGVIGLFALLTLPGKLVQPWLTITIYGYMMSLLILFFIPERLYGSTTELLEAKTLRIVETLEVILLSGQMEFSEAVYFQVKDHLTAAKRELRQQIDLAHRRF